MNLQQIAEDLAKQDGYNWKDLGAGMQKMYMAEALTEYKKLWS